LPAQESKTMMRQQKLEMQISSVKYLQIIQEDIDFLQS